MILKNKHLQCGDLILHSGRQKFVYLLADTSTLASDKDSDHDVLILNWIDLDTGCLLQERCYANQHSAPEYNIVRNGIKIRSNIRYRPNLDNDEI